MMFAFGLCVLFLAGHDSFLGALPWFVLQNVPQVRGHYGAVMIHFIGVTSCSSCPSSWSPVGVRSPAPCVPPWTRASMRSRRSAKICSCRIHASGIHDVHTCSHLLGIKIKLRRRRMSFWVRAADMSPCWSRKPLTASRTIGAQKDSRMSISVLGACGRSL